MIETISGILGVLLTILFGVYTLWKSKKDKKRVKLTFTRNECFSLFDSVVKKLNIEIKYNQKNFTNPLIFLKASIKNTGNIDIDKNMIFEPLNILSSDKYKWLEFNISSKPVNVITSVERISDRIIRVNWDLLKKGEELQIEALVEDFDDNSQDYSSVRFYDSITFDYRITNVDSIDKRSYFKEMINRPKYISLFYLLIGFLYVFIGGFAIFYPILKTKSYDIKYQIANKDQSEIGEINPISTKTIEFISERHIIEIPADSLKKDCKIKLFNISPIQRVQDTYIIPIIGLITLILSVFIFRLSYKRYQTYKKILSTTNYRPSIRAVSGG